jgi:hypothetical protein
VSINPIIQSKTRLVIHATTPNREYIFGSYIKHEINVNSGDIRIMNNTSWNDI